MIERYDADSEDANDLLEWHARKRGSGFGTAHTLIKHRKHNRINKTHSLELLNRRYKFDT
jgi:hypothetical protein